MCSVIKQNRIKSMFSICIENIMSLFTEKSSKAFKIWIYKLLNDNDSEHKQKNENIWMRTRLPFEEGDATGSWMGLQHDNEQRLSMLSNRPFQ